MSKNYVSLQRLSNFLDNLRTTFAPFSHNHNSDYDAKGSASAVQTNLDTVSDALDSHTGDSNIHVTATNKSNWNTAHIHSQSAHARTDATKVADSTTNGNILINDTETNVYSHPNSGVSAGTYKSVTVNAQGHVTGGSNPTTLAGYGITDGETKGAASSAVSTHNTSTSAHNDIRDLITGLTNRLNALADSDDTTLDQMSEIVAYIKSNKSLIDSITTSKVNVTDIVDNLTTNVANKPLSAAQGVEIKALIDALQSELDVKPDWNQNDLTKSDYIENRTHYISLEPVTLINETANCTMGSHTFSTYIDIKIGENYTVIFDGVTYECTGFSDGGLNTIGAPYNKYTDYPFNIYSYKNKLYMITQEYGFYPVEIIGNAEVFHKIDERYLPDTLAKVTDVEKVENSLSDKVSVSSMNGVELELVATVADHGYNSIAYDGNMYVAVGGQNYIYSTDGRNWTASTLPISCRGVAYGNGMFCGYGYSDISVCYSTDGINWSTATTNYNSNKFGISFLNGKFYISAGSAILYSADCVNWSESTLSKSLTLYSGAYGNGVYIMSGGGGTVVSTDGINWTTVTMPTTDYYDSICFANGRFVAFAHYTVNYTETNKIAYSTDGVNWTTGTLPISAKWVDAQYHNGMFVVAGFTAMVYSADGENWKVGSLLDGWDTIGCIGYGKELFIISAGQIALGKINPYDLVFKSDQEWKLLYDSGEIPEVVNSISGIDVSGYTNIQILVRIYNDGDSVGSRNGSAIFTCENGKSYQFPVWSNMFSKSINTVYTMATFKLVDGWLICPHASRLIGDASTFEDVEGGTAGSLVPTGSGMMKCTSPLSALTVSSLDQNSNYYFGMGSRVIVWGWNA